MARSPGKPFRAIDTGLRGGRANIAFDQALIEARKAGSRFPTPSAFCGFARALSSASTKSSVTRSSSTTARLTASRSCGASPAAAAFILTRGRSAGSWCSIAQALA